MAKNNYLKSKKRRAALAVLAAAAISCTGLAAACSSTDEEDKTTALAPKQEDTQLLKNGNFEFFNYPSDEYIADGKAVYLIKTPDSWTRSGDSSNAMSGIISTSAAGWGALTDAELKGKLAYNDDLKTNDENYIDYNGMKARDLLYKDTYAALLSASDVEESYIKYQTYEDYFGITESDGKFYFGEKEVKKRETAEGETEDNEYYFVNGDGSLGESVRFALIDNPGTHFTIEKSDSGDYYTDENGKKVTVYKDANGNYYYDAELKFPCENVLMVHNYPTNNNYNGIAQHFSSQTITLEANTAAEISVWVKTSDLKFDKGYSQLDDQDRGAFIEVTQSVNGTSLDSFKIKAINTEKIISENKSNPDVEQSNGWLKYTVYVNACDFASSTIQLNLGLGQSASNSEKCTGYAFFDDVSVTKFRSLDEKVLDADGNETAEYKSSFNDYATAIAANKTSCTLTSDADEKIFVADTDIRYHGNSTSSPEYLRHSQHFRYFIDLASENGTGTDDHYTAVTFGQADNTKVQLTAEKSNGKWYAVGTLDGETVKNDAILSGVVKGDTENYNLPDNVKGGIDTSKDLVGVFNSSGLGTIVGFDYSKKLNDALTGDNGFDKLPGYASTNNMLIMLSARGAAYTSTVTDGTLFKLGYDERMIVSFWVKTSDMNGSTAATVKITDVDDEDSSASFSLDTTDKKTKFGDEEDIYNGWVHCFLFVENTCDDKDEGTGNYVEKTFKIDFSFGVTSVASATASSFDYGWAAVANLQVLNVNEKIYKLTSAGDNSVKFSFSADSSSDSNKVFAEANGISDVKKEIANPNDYNGVNGGSSSVSDSAYSDGYDTQNTNSLAGLINREGAESYDNWNKITKAFTDTDAVKSWNEVFGDDCYQPLIIVSNLRRYVENASANENNYKNYYVEAESGYSGNAVSYDGKLYRKVADGDEYGEDTEYFSFAVNYGFIGNSKTVAADSYETVSVKVKVSAGANAYIYLVDSNTRKVLTYSTPEYTFYYDDEGNVLNTAYDKDDMSDEDHRAAIVYKLRKDGLYESADSTDTALYANLGNLVKSYKYYKYETNGKYYTTTENGKGVNEILFDDLVDGETYYDADGNIKPHFLCTESGKRVYEYYNGAYYYLVNGERKNEVKPFDTSKAPCRYLAPANDIPYMVNVNRTNSGSDWVTVNFFIHTGSESLDYRLEIWNGEREYSGVLEDGTYSEGAVAFDYSAYSASSDNYSNLRGEYETLLLNQYKAALESKNLLDRIDTKTETVKYFEKLADELIEEGVLTEDDLKGVDEYKAIYYTYTLYDANSYEPFNADVAAEGETGYDYKISDYDETLGFFTYKNDDENSYNLFADYSAVNKNIEKTTADDGDTDDGDTEDNPTNFWLYVASIILVVALLITLVSLLLRDVLKKSRRTKSEKALQKNNYRQRKRYIRKLHLVENEETDENDEAVDQAEETSEPVDGETESAEETVEETVDETVEDVPATDVPIDGADVTTDTAEVTDGSADDGDAASGTPVDDGNEDKPE